MKLDVEDKVWATTGECLKSLRELARAYHVKGDLVGAEEEFTAFLSVSQVEGGVKGSLLNLDGHPSCCSGHKVESLISLLKEHNSEALSIFSYEMNTSTTPMSEMSRAVGGHYLVLSLRCDEFISGNKSHTFRAEISELSGVGHWVLETPERERMMFAARITEPAFA